MTFVPMGTDHTIVLGYAPVKKLSSCRTLELSDFRALVTIFGFKIVLLRLLTYWLDLVGIYVT